jgi:endonuclease/exonuclease/phosphatase family metal-dependent hydrolase
VHDGVALGLPVGADDQLVEPSDSDRPLAGVTFADAPYGAREPRCVVGGRLETDGDGATVFSTHLTYAGTAQRHAQAEAVARLARAVTGPVVVLADLNARIEAPEVVPLATTLDDAFTAIGVPPGDGRRASCGPLAIDHILTRDLVVDACRVVREVGDVSDHLPVVATLRHPPRSRSSSRAT